MSVYKASEDSYTGSVLKPGKNVGVWQLRSLSKAGLKTHDADRLMAFYYYAYQTALCGFDYVVLSSKRTNSGREEAVIVTSKCVNMGKKLSESGYSPITRKAYDHVAKLCKNDFRVPDIEEPKYYAHLPELIKEQPCDKKVVETHEDELMALIDCITGEGNRSKAFRAIARYLIREAINIEEEEKEKENG